MIINTEYTILTPTGYSDFDGISKKTTNIIFLIKFDNGSLIKCTENHLIKFTDSEFLEACLIQEGDIIFGNKRVVEVSYEEGSFEVFDPINVKLNGEYYSNDIISHNCAFISNVEEIWIAAQQTLATGGGAIILSTPNGTGNFFHKTWVKAEAKEGQHKFNPIRLHWSVHPDRNQSWRDKQDELLGSKAAGQECDCDFVSSGHTVIEGTLLQWYKQTTVQDPIEKRGIDGNLWIWEQPDYSRDYIIVADVARGDGADHSAFHVIDVESVTQVAEYKGQIHTKDYGNLLVNIATEYNDALLVIENANVGWASIQVAIDRNYKNMYYSPKDGQISDVSQQLSRYVDLKDTSQMTPGFTTSSRTRPLIISKLDTYMRERIPIIRSQRLIDELFVFIWNGSKPEAQHGYNDDLVLSFCIGLWIRDTALKLRQQGMELNRKTLDYFGKGAGAYNATAGNMKHSGWSMETGRRGEDESLTWLI